jgi:short chain dehydrogenase
MTETHFPPETDTSPLRAIYPGLTGKIAVVTGGSRGIGAATAAALAANGASVAVVGRDTAAIDRTVEAITMAGGRAIGVVADCTVEADVDALRQVVTDRLGPADVVAAFAGGDGMPVATAAETVAHWRRVIESDLTSTFLTVAAFLPSMMARKTGVIITMASAAARQPARSSAAYDIRRPGRARCLVPPRTNRPARRRRGRCGVPGLVGGVLDYRDHPRYRGRKNHGLTGAPGPGRAGPGRAGPGSRQEPRQDLLFLDLRS